MGITLSRGKGPLADMNVVPLIDILLVLLIIFMVISPKTPLGLDAEAPQNREDASQTPPEPDPLTVVISLSADGKLSINQEEATWETMGARLEEIFKSRATRVAFIWAEPDVQFQEMARAISIMRSSGIERVGLLPAEFGRAVGMQARAQAAASPPNRR
jgi:biopolymer transport protein ExbD